jgi:hypothetical protein
MASLGVIPLAIAAAMTALVISPAMKGVSTMAKSWGK